MERPDLLTLIGPEYDYSPPHPAKQTLIICSAPRTGSYELCRYLIAAGIGVPHEYFNPNYARRLGERWGLGDHPLHPSRLDQYIKLLRAQRVQQDVFGTKLQFPHFQRNLRNEYGRQLFAGATVVHLFRPDAVAQYVSYRNALKSGIWDFSGRATTPPITEGIDKLDVFLKQALQQLNWLMRQDAAFRCVFTMLDIRPIFVTTDELFQRPRDVVHRIANAMQVTCRNDRLAAALKLSAPYSRARKKYPMQLAEYFKRVLFRGN